jgi:hypothetical protein
MVATYVEDDLGAALSVRCLAQHDLNRDRAVVEQPLELPEFLVDDSAGRGCHLDVPTGDSALH